MIMEDLNIKLPSLSNILNGLCEILQELASCHDLTMFLSCFSHFCVMMSSRCCHVLVTFLSCSCHVLGMFLSCSSCHFLFMFLSCSCHVKFLSRSCHVLTMFSSRSSYGKNTTRSCRTFERPCNNFARFHNLSQDITESTLQDLETMLKLGNHNYFKLKPTTKQLTQTGIVIVVCAIAVAVSVFTEGFHASPARTIAAQAFLSADCW